MISDYFSLLRLCVCGFPVEFCSINMISSRELHCPQNGDRTYMDHLKTAIECKKHYRIKYGVLSLFIYIYI